MNKTYPLIIPMVDWSLDVKKDHFLPQEEYKENLSDPDQRTIRILLICDNLDIPEDCS
jgi:hypothetical protein